MKRLLAGALVLSVAVVANADTPIYDTITGATNLVFTTQTGNNLAADNFAPPSPGAGNLWQIDSISWLVAATAPGSYLIPYSITVYKGVGMSTTATDPAFTDPAAVVTGTLSFNNSTTGSAIALASVTGLSITLPTVADNPGTGFGVRFMYGASNVPGGILTAVYAQNPSSVAGSGWSNGFFIDQNGDSTIQNNEFTNGTGWQDGNLCMAIGANPVAVPEPASMAILGVGALALIRRRRCSR